MRAGACHTHTPHGPHTHPGLQALVFTIAVAGAVLGVLITSRGAISMMPATITFAVVGFVGLLLLSLHLLLMLFYGAKANNAAQEHAAQLLCRGAEARQRAQAARREGDAAAATAASDTADMLDAARLIVLADGEMEPVRILGIPATSALLRTLAAGAASAASAIVAMTRSMSSSS